MPIVLHPYAFVKSYAKVIPRNEMNPLVLGLGANTLVKCTIWPITTKVAPEKHVITTRTLAQICQSASAFPMTCSHAGKIEPQVVAEDMLYSEEHCYRIETDDAAPVVLSGRSIVHASLTESVSVNKLTKTFKALAHTDSGFRAKQYRVYPHGESHNCMRISMWEQPYRVQHTSAYLICGNGLLLG